MNKQIISYDFSSNYYMFIIYLILKINYEKNITYIVVQVFKLCHVFLNFLICLHCHFIERPPHSVPSPNFIKHNTSVIDNKYFEFKIF